MSRPGRGRSSRRTFLQLAGLTALARPLAAAAQPAAPRFTDITIAAGLGMARNTSGSALNKQLLLEEMGCGVAIIDYDNDGWPDIFLVNGASSAPAAARKPTSYLLHNNRDGTFTDVTRNAVLIH